MDINTLFILVLPFVIVCLYFGVRADSVRRKCFFIIDELVVSGNLKVEKIPRSDVARRKFLLEIKDKAPDNLKRAINSYQKLYRFFILNSVACGIPLFISIVIEVYDTINTLKGMFE